MTTVIRHHHNPNYYIVLEINRAYGISYYEIQAYPIHGGIAGYPEHSMTYPLSDKRNAYATFNRYKRKYV